jgi:hypothetical protein
MSKFQLSILILWTLPLSASAEVLWDNWYTVTEHGAPTSYYNEKAELVGDRAKIQVNTWIKEGSKVRSENFGGTAKNTSLLEPLFYNFRTQVNGEEKIVDGTVSKNGKVFSVKSKTGIESPKTLRAEMLPKLILTYFFPVWVNKNYKRINGVQPIEFMSILEDQVEKEVPVIKGSAYEMRQDDFAKSTNTRKLRIEFNRLVAFWWVTPKGDAIKIELPSQEKIVKKSDRAKAESWLNQ